MSRLFSIFAGGGLPTARRMHLKLFVGGLSWDTDSNGLRAAFESFGSISEAVVVQDRETGRSRGFGFVTFDTDDSARAAMKAMDGSTLDGRTIKCNEAQERTGGPRGGGGGFGGPRGGGGGGGGPRGGGGGGGYRGGGGGGGGGRGGGGGYGGGGGGGGGYRGGR